MRKLLIVAGALAASVLAGAIASAQNLPPRAPAAISATSGNVAAAAATATIAAPTTAGQANYLCGFQVRSLGATASTSVALTITGLIGGTMTMQYLTVAGATTANQPFGVEFTVCLQGTPDTAVVVSLPSLGAGNTNAMVNAWGYRF